MDYLLNISNSSNNQIPSKLIDYFFSGKKIINICNNTENNVEQAINVSNNYIDILDLLNSLTKDNSYIQYVEKQNFTTDYVRNEFNKLFNI